MTNPFIDGVWFISFLVVICVVGLFNCFRRKSKSNAVESKVAERLKKVLGVENISEARERVFALIPCRQKQLNEYFANKGAWSASWLALLNDRIVMMPANSPDAIHLKNELTRVAFVESGKVSKHHVAIEIDDSGYVVEVNRLDDKVRLVNVCIQYQVGVGFRSK